MCEGSRKLDEKTDWRHSWHCANDLNMTKTFLYQKAGISYYSIEMFLLGHKNSCTYSLTWSKNYKNGFKIVRLISLSQIDLEVSYRNSESGSRFFVVAGKRLRHSYMEKSEELRLVGHTPLQLSGVRVKVFVVARKRLRQSYMDKSE